MKRERSQETELKLDSVVDVCACVCVRLMYSSFQSPEYNNNGSYFRLSHSSDANVSEFRIMTYAIRMQRRNYRFYCNSILLCGTYDCVICSTSWRAICNVTFFGIHSYDYKLFWSTISMSLSPHRKWWMIISSSLRTFKHKNWIDLGSEWSERTEQRFHLAKCIFDFRFGHRSVLAQLLHLNQLGE